VTKKKFSESRPFPGRNIIVSWEDGSPAVGGYVDPSDHTMIVNSERPLGSSCSRHELRAGCVWWEVDDPDAPDLNDPPIPQVPTPKSDIRKIESTPDSPYVDLASFSETSATIKENPKDTIGSKKLPFSALPWAVIAEVAAGMGEGAIKYGKHNYETVGVRHSIYFDATLRHLIADFLGEDIDPDSGVSHISKAIASLCVLRDAQMYGKCTDDRPPAPPADQLAAAKSLFSSLIENVTDCGKHYDRESLRKRNEL